jgi:hypothetical protein
MSDTNTSGGAGFNWAGALGGGIGSMIGLPFEMYAANAETQKMNQMLNNELVRQLDYEQQGQGILAQHIKDSGLKQSNQDIAKGRGDAQHAYQQLPSLAPSQISALPTLGASFHTPQVASAQALAQGNSAAAQGYTDWGVKQALETLKAKTKLAQNAQFAQGSESVLPAELSDAQNSKSDIASIGKLLGAVGGLAGGFL